jgi:hypothetical protein
MSTPQLTNADQFEFHFPLNQDNPDRRPGNIEVDNTAKPERCWIFDHEQALFGHFADDALRRLDVMRESLGLSYLLNPRCSYHCFLGRLTKSSHFDDWYHRICNIPRWFIKEACSEIPHLGATPEMATAAEQFLLHRRDFLPAIVEAHQSSFANMEWSPKGRLF